MNFIQVTCLQGEHQRGAKSGPLQYQMCTYYVRSSATGVSWLWSEEDNIRIIFVNNNNPALRELLLTTVTGFFMMAPFLRCLTGESAILLQKYLSNFKVTQWYENISLQDFVRLYETVSYHFVLRCYWKCLPVNFHRFLLRKQWHQEHLDLYCDKFSLTGQLHIYPYAKISLGMRPANTTRRYNITTSFIDWAHTQTDPWIWSWVCKQYTRYCASSAFYCSAVQTVIWLGGMVEVFLNESIIHLFIIIWVTMAHIGKSKYGVFARCWFSGFAIFGDVEWPLSVMQTKVSPIALMVWFPRDKSPKKILPA